MIKIEQIPTKLISDETIKSIVELIIKNGDLNTNNQEIEQLFFTEISDNYDNAIIAIDENGVIVAFLLHQINNKTFNAKKQIKSGFFEQLDVILNVVNYEISKENEKFNLIFKFYCKCDELIITNFIKKLSIENKIKKSYFIAFNKKFLKNKKVYFKHKIKSDKYEIKLIIQCNELDDEINDYQILDNSLNKEDIFIKEYKCNNILNNDKNLILIHGLCSSSETWNPVIAQLKESFNVYAIDLPLHANSTKSGNWDIFKFGILLSELINKKFVDKKIILWGHSMGGAVAAIANILTNDKVDNLILECPYTYNDKNLGVMLMHMISAHIENHNNVYNHDKNKWSFYNEFKRIYTPIKKNTMEFLISVFNKKILEYVDLAYKLNKKPSLIMVSNDDSVLDGKIIKEYFNDKGDNVQVYELCNCHHSPHHYNPQLVTNLVKYFLEKTNKSS